MDDTQAVKNSLEFIYMRLHRMAKLVRQGRGNTSNMEDLLNQTVQTSDAGKNLAFLMKWLARDRRKDFIQFLRYTNRPCLLLLLDGRAIAAALRVDGIIDIRTGDDGKYHITRTEGHVGSARNNERGNDRGNNRGNKHGNKRDNKRGNNRRARGSSAGPPVMDLDECHEVLAALGGPLELESEGFVPLPGSTPSKNKTETSMANYLSALVGESESKDATDEAKKDESKAKKDESKAKKGESKAKKGESKAKKDESKAKKDESKAKKDEAAPVKADELFKAGDLVKEWGAPEAEEKES